MDDTPLLGTCAHAGKNGAEPHAKRSDCIRWRPTPKEGPGMTPEPLPDPPAQEWCEVDSCPATICNGPHVEHVCADGARIVARFDNTTPCPFCGAVTSVAAGAPGVPTTEGGPHSIYIPADGPPTIIENCYTTSPPVPSLGVEDGSDPDVYVPRAEYRMLCDLAADRLEVIRQRDEAVELLRVLAACSKADPLGRSYDERVLADVVPSVRAFLASLPSGDEG